MPTLTTWVFGYTRRQPGHPAMQAKPILSVPDASTHRRGAPIVPFVGLAEGLVLAAVRRSGVPMQRIRPALDALADGLGVDHALASKRLYTDGAEILWDFAESSGDADARQLVVLRSDQLVLADIVAEYLRLITYDDSGYARIIRLPAYKTAEVVADPQRSWGQPVFARGGARVNDVLDRFSAGEDIAALSAEFGVPAAEVEDAVRVATRRAA